MRIVIQCFAHFVTVAMFGFIVETVIANQVGEE